MVDISWFWTLFLSVILIYLLNRFYKMKGYWEKRGVPTAKSPWFITLKMLFIRKKTFNDLTAELYQYNKHEKYVGYVLQNPVLLVHDPELINRILIKDFSYFEDRAKPVQGELELGTYGLFSLTGSSWRVYRHKLTPTFTSNKMKIMFKQLKECSEEFVQYVNGKIGTDLETRDFLFKFMINANGATAFSIKVDAFNEENKNNEFLQMSKQFFNPSLKTQLKYVIATILPRLKNVFNVRLIDTDINDFFVNLTKNLIAQRRKPGNQRNDFLQLMLDIQDKKSAIVKNQFELNKEASTPDKNAEAPEDRELLEYIKYIEKGYASGALFNDESIAAQTFLFISAGTETTSTVLSFALHELAVNETIQRRLQDEIDTVIKTNEFNYDSIKKMKYLEQILYEVLRLHFSSMLTRICVKNYKVPDTDLVIEKDCLIQIPTIGIHTDAQYYPDPFKFNPDRFEDMDAIPKGAFLPFGDGPRMCIAMRLAMLQMKIFLATVMSEFNVVHSLKTPLPLQMDRTSLLMHVKGGLWVKFERRQ